MTNGKTPKLTSTVALARPVILILPEGKTQGERSHNKGHLFEEFIALLMELHGYEKPTRRNINVTSNGIELDVSIQHRMTKQRAIAECKAYSMEPFGANEISSLLSRLQVAAGTKLQTALKQRLREVSQGLPWLFKKLASHIDRELKLGTTQEVLVIEALNVKRLFDSDLAELTLHEREALKKFAKLAPRSASEVVEIIPKDIRENPNTSTRELGTLLADAYGVIWTPQTTELVGKTFRSWAKTAGVIPKVRAKRKPAEQEPNLFKETPDTTSA